MQSNSSSDIEFSVIVPEHNEAENLTILLPRLYLELSKLPVSFEIVLVDNASTDRSAQVIAEFQKTMPELRLVLEPKLGYGRAVLLGLKEARGVTLGIMRSDNQEKVEDLALMYLSLTKEKKDLYKAIRRTRTNDGLKRVVVSIVYNTLFKILFNLKSRDLNATPKVFTRQFYESVHLVSEDWFIDPEIVIKAERLGYSVGETYIEYLPRLSGTSNVRFRHILEFLMNMIKWHIRLRYGKLLER